MIKSNIIACLIVLNVVASINGLDILNFRPIIGILDEPSPEPWLQYGTTWITASNVKWLEASGARVVPVPFNSSVERLTSFFNSINGLMLGGGGLGLQMDSQYYETAKFFFSKAQESYDSGDFFPIWGTCQGFQLLSILAADNETVDIRNDFGSENLPLPLIFTPKAEDSRMISRMSSDILTSLQTENITINLHHDGIPPTFFKTNENLKNYFKLLSYNYDRKGNPFASLMEGRIYPFFGAQFHPERNLFEWDFQELASHSKEAVIASQYFGDFFIDETRKNYHRFPNATAEEEALIYQFTPTFTGDMNISTYPDQQTYFFNFNYA